SRMMATQATASSPASGPADLAATQPPPAQAAQHDTVMGHAAPSPHGAPQSRAPSGGQDPNATQAPAGGQAPLAATQAPPAPPAAAQAGGKKKLDKLGEYKLVKRLGAGGMGEVFKGYQASLDRDVAVKVLFKHLASNADFVQRFQREARIMAKLD